MAIKSARGRRDFAVDAVSLRAHLLRGRLLETSVTGAHGAATADLPPLHKDPFDRLLIAQARLEGAMLLTTDASLARYGAPVLLAD